MFFLFFLFGLSDFVVFTEIGLGVTKDFNHKAVVIIFHCFYTFWVYIKVRIAATFIKTVSSLVKWKRKNASVTVGDVKWFCWGMLNGFVKMVVSEEITNTVDLPQKFLFLNDSLILIGTHVVAIMID